MKKIVILYEDGTIEKYNRCSGNIPTLYYLMRSKARDKIVYVSEQKYPLKTSSVEFFYKNPRYYG